MNDPSESLSPASQLSLLRPLAEVQLDLLETIWRPVVDSRSPWPVWDYVERTMYRQSPPVNDAGSVRTSLPSVPTGIQLTPYGLVWRGSGDTTNPHAEERVGLSIAGLYQLSGRRPEAGELADLLARFIGFAANWERDLVPEPSAPVSMDVPLDDKLPQLVAGSEALSQVSVTDLCDILQREYAYLGLRRDSNGTNPLLMLRMNLAPFHGVTTASQYLERIAARQPARPLAQTVSPLLVVQMLDYLSLVLAADPRWPEHGLVATPDLRAAATIALDVIDEVQFRDRMSALAALLSNLRTPAVPKEIAIKRYGQQPKPLQRLRYRIETNLDQSEGQQRAIQAVDDLRDMMLLRNEGQHPSSELREKAAVVRRRLGLPELVLDWAVAWDTVRARVAEACEVIAQEVRLSA